MAYCAGCSVGVFIQSEQLPSFLFLSLDIVPLLLCFFLWQNGSSKKQVQIVHNFHKIIHSAKLDGFDNCQSFA